MFRHVVMFRWNDDVDQAHVRAVADSLDALPTTIPVITAYQHGPDAGVNEGNFDYVVVADFASVDDYLTYRGHPVHQAFLQHHIVGRIAARAAVQYHLDG
jgi:hypothetical protein